jgi:hypothetical protein
VNKVRLFDENRKPLGVVFDGELLARLSLTPESELSQKNFIHKI